jgi:hypothetical protein
LGDLVMAPIRVIVSHQEQAGAKHLDLRRFVRADQASALTFLLVG